MDNETPNKDIYFAEEPTENIGNRLVTKVNDYYDYIYRNGWVSLWQKLHAQFYRGYYINGEVEPYGELGEKRKLFVNHFRNILEHIKVLTTDERPVFEPRAINNDYKSYVQTKFARQLLDYFMKQEDLEDVIDAAVDMALIGGEGFTVLEWDKNHGKIVDEAPEEEIDVEAEEDEESPEDAEIESMIKREGGVFSRAYHPIDVARDVDSDNTEDNNWFVVRKRCNKFELAAKYPKRREEIINSYYDDLDKITRCTLDLFDSKRFQDGEQVYTYIFRHKKTAAMPEGREVEFLMDGTVLFDGDLPYADIAMYPMRFASMRGNNFGYSIAFDMLPIQRVIDMLDSTIVTNQNAFGIQCITAKKGSGTTVSDLATGMKLIEHLTDEPPKPLNLLSTPAEIFNYKNDLIQQMETVSGINSVSRGNPEASLKSGAALALVQSMAIQFNSGLQHNYAQALERIGTGLVNILKEYASAPRMIQIAGRGSGAYLKEFTGEDLDRIDRVIVEVGNPMSKTIAGKMSIADTLVERGLVKSVEQYIEMLETGRYEPLVEHESLELMNIRSENEILANPEPSEQDKKVMALFTDNHALHIREHSGVVNSIEARNNVNVVQKVTAHVQEHIQLLKTTDPAFLMLNGQQPLPPDQVAPPVPNQDIANTPTQGQSPQPTPPGEQTMPGPQADQGLPSAEDVNLPNNPLSGEDFNLKDGGLPN